MSKSHVSIERKICPITGETFDSGVVLFDKRMRSTLERNTVTGFEICPEAQKQLDKGYIAFVGVDEEKSDKLPNGNISPVGAYKTGKVIYVRKEFARDVFGDVVLEKPFCYCDEELVQFLKTKQDEAEAKNS